MLLTCAICFHLFASEEESWVVTLTCGHKFHLDCIREALNMNGEMMCPICQTIEKVESPPFPDHDLLLYHAIFAEHMAASPLARSNVVHVLPVPSAVSNATNVQYQSWGHNSPQASAIRIYLDGVNQALDPSTLKTTRASAELRTADSSLPRCRSSLNHREYRYQHEEQNDHLGYPSGMSFERDSGWESEGEAGGSSVISFERDSGWKSDLEEYGSSDPTHIPGNF